MLRGTGAAVGGHRAAVAWAGTPERGQGYTQLRKMRRQDGSSMSEHSSAPVPRVASRTTVARELHWGDPGDDNAGDREPRRPKPTQPGLDAVLSLPADEGLADLALDVDVDLEQLSSASRRKVGLRPVKP